MSKKTNAINECLDKLDGYQKSLHNIIEASLEENRELSDIDFGLSQELRSLRFWIESLYKFNGKSTSVLKKNASKENGKKGGRPPREITAAKNRIAELDLDIIPSLEKQMMNSDSNEAISEFENAINDAKNELEELQDKVFEYKRSKELKDSLTRI